MRSHIISRSVAVIVGGVLALTACDLTTDLEPDPDTVPLDEILLLYRARGSLPLVADGQAVDTLIALIPRDATIRVVTFNTSIGGFLLGGGAKELRVRAEYEPAFKTQHLVARAVLRADTISGLAVVSATVADFRRYEYIQFIEAN